MWVSLDGGVEGSCQRFWKGIVGSVFKLARGRERRGRVLYLRSWGRGGKGGRQGRKGEGSMKGGGGMASFLVLPEDVPCELVSSGYALGTGSDARKGRPRGWGNGGLALLESACSCETESR